MISGGAARAAVLAACPGLLCRQRQAVRSTLTRGVPTASTVRDIEPRRAAVHPLQQSYEDLFNDAFRMEEQLRGADGSAHSRTWGKADFMCGQQVEGGEGSPLGRPGEGAWDLVRKAAVSRHAEPAPARCPANRPPPAPPMCQTRDPQRVHVQRRGPSAARFQLDSRHRRQRGQGWVGGWAGACVGACVGECEPGASAGCGKSHGTRPVWSCPWWVWQRQLAAASCSLTLPLLNPRAPPIHHQMGMRSWRCAPAATTPALPSSCLACRRCRPAGGVQRSRTRCAGVPGCSLPCCHAVLASGAGRGRPTAVVFGVAASCTACFAACAPAPAAPQRPPACCAPPRRVHQRRRTRPLG